MHTVILHTNNSMTTLQQYINSRCLWTWKIVHSARTMRIANKFRNEMQSVRQQLNTFPELIPIQMDMLSPLCVCVDSGAACARSCTVLCIEWTYCVLLQMSTRDESASLCEFLRSNISLSISMFALFALAVFGAWVIRPNWIILNWTLDSS